MVQLNLLRICTHLDNKAAFPFLPCIPVFFNCTSQLYFSTGEGGCYPGYRGCCSICPLCLCIFNCISQLYVPTVFLNCFSTEFLNCFPTVFLDCISQFCISQLAEEDPILDIGAAVPSVPCVRLGSRQRFAAEPTLSLSRPRGGNNTVGRQHPGHRDRTRAERIVVLESILMTQGQRARKHHFWIKKWTKVKHTWHHMGTFMKRSLQISMTINVRWW